MQCGMRVEGDGVLCARGRTGARNDRNDHATPRPLRLTKGVWESMAASTEVKPSASMKAVRPAGVAHNNARLLSALSTMPALEEWWAMVDCAAQQITQCQHQL
jgi:hypothetical protein